MIVAGLTICALSLAFVGLGAGMNYEEHKDDADGALAFLLIIVALACAFFAGRAA